MRKLVYTFAVLLWSLSLVAQQKTVSGKIFDSNNTPVVGASVSLKGSTSVVITNDEGNFSISVPENGTLIITHIGHESKEVQLGKQTQYSITLERANVNLGEVVVVGYTTQKKADLTGAVSVVEVKELKKMPNNNPMQALQGRIAGMQITTDGSPSGGNVGIQIRGISSINGNSPLLVIDGVPTKAGMHELNPNDIETIQVLKDASAASIYGSRASSGVIIITTKRAKKGEFNITANARRSYAWYQSRMQVLNSEEYGRAAWQANANDGNPIDKYLVYNYEWDRNTEGVAVLNRIILPEYIDGPNNTMKTSNTDWFKEISRTAVYQTYDVQISRGTDKGSTVLSLDYTKNEGIVNTTDFRRISARINTDFRMLNDRLVIGENFTANTTREVLGNTLNAALQALPVIPVRTVDGIGWGGPWGGMNDRQNPVRLLEMNKQNNYDLIRLLGNVYADLEIINGLNFRSSVGLDYQNYTARNMQLRYVSGYLNNPLNQVSMNNWNNTQFVWTNTLNYKKTINDHRVEFLAGTEMIDQKGNDFWASRRDFAFEDDDYMYLGAGVGQKDNGGGASQFRLMSYFGKANYSFDDKYLASFTARYDGSSRFGRNNQFAFFPSFSLGWRLNKEQFISDALPMVSDLKLRFGWGQTGNQDNIDPTANRTLYRANPDGGDPTWRTPDGTAYDFSGSGSGTLPSGYQIIQRANDDLKWETTTQSNIGLDFGLFNQKIYGSLDYFVKTTSDMLIRPAYIAVIGEGGSRWVNGASLKNQGIELQLGYRGKIANKVNFDFNGNISTYRNKVTKLPEEVVNTYGGNGTTDNILNRPWGSGYGYVADGIFKTEDEVFKSAEQLGKGLGRIRYKDLNGDGMINDKDRTWIINPTPDYIYGFNFNFEYKGFDLTIFFQGVGNQQINVFDVKSQSDFWSLNETGSNKGTRLLNAWTAENSGSDIPALTATDRNFERRFSTYFIENGAYLKLRNLQIGYTLPKSITSRIMANNVNIYVSGQNLLTFKAKNFTGIDPEAAGFGYPIPTMLTGGIRLTL
jgi:TonB-linked SusC/RagA family outer membrane protein